MAKFNLTPIFFGFSLALVDVITLGLVKMIKNKTFSSSYGIPLVVLFYGMEPLIFLKALNYEGMVITNLLWDLSSDVLVTLQGIFIFNEKFTPIKWLGICLSIISILLFSIAD